MPRKKNEFKVPSIRLRKDGLYEARIYIGINPTTKKQVVESVYGKTEKEVKEKALQIQKQKSRNEAMNLEHLTVRDWLDKWLNEYKIHSLKRSTYDNYLSLMNTFIVPKIGDIRLDKLTRNIVHGLYTEMTDQGFSASTVHNIHKILHGSLEQAVAEGIVSINPCYKLPLPKLPAQNEKPLTDEEIEKLTSALRENSYDNGILFMLNSGMRVGEMLALKWDDINFDEGYISVSKTIKRVTRTGIKGESGTKTELAFESPKTENSNRLIPISSALAAVLSKQQSYIRTARALSSDAFKDNGFIFSAENGSPIDPRNFSRHLESVCTRAGIRKLHSHIFRHTFISIAVKNKVDPRLLKRIVGHANVSMTDSIYTHLDVDDLRESMEKIK